MSISLIDSEYYLCYNFNTEANGGKPLLNNITRLTDNLYRLYIPFEELYTAIFFAVYEEGVVIIDSATYQSDADEYILPALRSLCICPEEVRVIALTHRHGDHSGGAARLSELLPNAEIVATEPPKGLSVRIIGDGDLVLGVLRTVILPGHTEKSAGFFDEGNGTLLSGDCLQLGGIGKYRNGIKYPELYKASVERVRGMNVKRLVASHEYDPLGSAATGRKEIEKYLDCCLEYV